ncbi:TfoX/Sxy family protein [Litoreibacter janthinus]|uniref:DNA transformation protein n=1 Tax=Litoreibacter janthinus TaxID=670154 RepID=A0A1I6HHM4_9RHOB|nr:TfoX/Sxy family protein [Litoreibacter janthinus]SFR53961.1 DNA transformation protein [Litoreibacter janthinus]
MSVSEADIAFARELFAPLPAISTRKMMGGLCLYSEGTIFALLYSDGQIYLKAKGDFVAEIEGLGGTRWTYTRKDGKVTGMPYWSLPDQFLDDPSEASALAARALEHL